MYRGILSCVRRVARPLCWHLERKDTLSKIIIALIAVAIVALAIACGGDDSAEPAATPTPVATATESAVTPTATSRFGFADAGECRSVAWSEWREAFPGWTITHDFLSEQFASASRGIIPAIEATDSCRARGGNCRNEERAERAAFNMADATWQQILDHSSEINRIIKEKCGVYLYR